MSDICGYQISSNNFMKSGSKLSLRGCFLKKSGSFFKSNGDLKEVLLHSRSGSNNLVRLVHDDSVSLVSKKQHYSNIWKYKSEEGLDEFKSFLLSAMFEVFLFKNN